MWEKLEIVHLQDAAAPSKMSLDGKPLKLKQVVSFHANKSNFPSSNSFNLILEMEKETSPEKW